MAYNPQSPLIVQGDKTILVEVNNDLYEEVRDEVASFAELEKSPEHIHTYKISPLSLWNACSGGMNGESIIAVLEKYSKFDLPQNVTRDITDLVRRFGKIKLVREGSELLLVSEDKYTIQEIMNHKKIQPYLLEQRDGHQIVINQVMRGHIKQAMIKIGLPVEDIAGYEPGQPFDMALRDITIEGKKLEIRDYQKHAADIFYGGGSVSGGSGVIVLPCGAGKTVTGMVVMDRIKTETLILTTNITALRQWKQELLDKTTLKEEDIGEYSGEVKEVKPVTLTTYQILTHRNTKNGDFPHFSLFNKKNWGFIIYDEVHMLPAPVFRVTSEIQAKRRLGLTATLIREDGLEEDVFSLIGPKKADVPWKVLEKKGWVACANCMEVRVPMTDSIRMNYAVSGARQKFRIASENAEKIPVISRLLDKHSNDNILIIGQYIDQLNTIAKEINAPLITGKTPNNERISLYDEFKAGRLKRIVVSKVANFAIDLPDANVAIQVSGTFGSRQEEAQRLGRVLRPKQGENIAYFYSLVTADSREQDFAANRQLFLTEQGYKYYIKSADEIESSEYECL